MKKTLLALAVAAFATSASAVTLYEQDGTKVELGASLKLLLSKDQSKVGKSKSTTGHTYLRNDNSNFSIKVKHNIADDFYALASAQFRFSGGDAAQFGNVYAHEAFAGFGSKQAGELTFGRQGSNTGNALQADVSNKFDDYFEDKFTKTNNVVRYTYKGVEGLTVGADYHFADSRDGKKGTGEVVYDADEPKIKSGYAVGGNYTFDGLTVGAGYSRANYKVASSTKHHRDAYGVGAKYVFNGVTLGTDFAGAFEKQGDQKTRHNGFRVSAKFDVTSDVAAYGSFGYGVEVVKAGQDKTKTRGHGFLVGSSYKLHKNVLTYAEVGYTSSKEQGKDRRRDVNAGVGLQVSF